MTHDTRAHVTLQPAGVVFRKGQHDAPRDQIAVSMMDVYDSSSPFSNARLATVELVRSRDNEHGPFTRAVWLLWFDLQSHPAEDTEFLEWIVPDARFVFDAQRDTGTRTDVLIAYVWPALRNYLQRVAPFVSVPSIVDARGFFTAEANASA